MIEKNKKAVSKRKVKYEATIEGLTNDLDYYIRAYAINAVDTAYGEILPFKTKDGLGSVKTLFPVNVMSTSVQCGGMITKQGEAEIEERGIYLMLNPEPSASDSTIRIDMEADSFYCTISDLNRKLPITLELTQKVNMVSITGRKSRPLRLRMVVLY